MFEENCYVTSYKDVNKTVYTDKEFDKNFIANVLNLDRSMSNIIYVSVFN